MFESFNDLPLHPLVVHAVVVLLPLAAIGTVAIAVRPVWRRIYGPLVLTATVVATALIPVATQSGDKLSDHVGRPETHAERGEQLIWFALPLLVLVIALVVLDRRTPAPGKTLITAVAALSVVAAAGVAFQVYRVGDAGSRAVWEGKLDQTVVPPG